MYPLTIDLLILPVALFLLLFLPCWMTGATLVALLLVAIWVLLMRKELTRCRGPLILGSLYTLILIVVAPLHCSALEAQLLSIGGYLTLRLGHFLLGGWREEGVWVSRRVESCCGERRRKALVLEYQRFRRIIFVYFVFVELVGWGILLYGSEFEILLTLLSWFIPLFMIPMYVLEGTHLKWMERRLNTERWLTVFDSSNRPIGRVAQTQFSQAQGRLAVVRLLAVSQGMVYIEQTPSICSLGLTSYDTPFVDWVCEDSTPDQIAQNLIDERFCGVRRARPRQLLQYHAEEAGIKLVIHLYSVQIPDPTLLLIDCQPIRGKWWSLDLLTAELGRDAFSRHLSYDIPYLEQTSLLAEKLHQRADR